jgi:hypothetical protein
MSDEELMQKVQALRADGHSPREIARALGVRPAAVAELVRTIARQRAADAPEPAIRGCWVSRGWSDGLTVEERADWPDVDAGVARPSASGLVGVLVAREDRAGRLSACGYLVDTYCLGVKDALGPRVMRGHELSGFVRRYFVAFGAPPLAVPIELAQHLVLGAVDYARGLGFEPHPDFEAARGHLGPWCGPGAIGFGRDGRPMFVEGAADDVAGVLRTLEGSLGRGNFEFIVSLGPEGDVPAIWAA